MDTDKRLMEVVGVVSDVRDAGLDIEARPTLYGYSLQRPQWWQVSRLSIVTRAVSDRTSLHPAMRAAVQALRPDVPLRFRTLEQVFSSSLDQRRFSLVLFGVFALVALLIAAIGIYGVIAHAVTQRTQELGVRIALGAQAKDIMKMVVGQGMKLALIGTAFGLLASFAVTRLMKELLFGVGAADPLTFGLIALLLVLTTLLASYIPARRATKVDPIIALRSE
jgi:ABC-type antimicrobial peptide transport system permease subunit